eukprot:gene5247-5911_t
MSAIYLPEDVSSLLKGKTVIYIGDSVQRSMYKDLVLLFQDKRYLTDKELRKKGEECFLGDELMEGGCKGEMVNSTKYREVRKYLHDNNTKVLYFFITACFGQYIEMILSKLKTPDIIIMNSCLWDVHRYGTKEIQNYEANLFKLIRFVKKTHPKTLFLWTTTPPVDLKSKGGFLRRPGTDEVKISEVSRCNRIAKYVMGVESMHLVELDTVFHHFTRHRASDGVHWNEKAHRRMTNMILEKLSRALCKDVPRVMLDDGRFVANNRPGLFGRFPPHRQPYMSHSFSYPDFDAGRWQGGGMFNDFDSMNEMSSNGGNYSYFENEDEIMPPNYMPPHPSGPGRLPMEVPPLMRPPSGPGYRFGSSDPIMFRENRKRKARDEELPWQNAAKKQKRLVAQAKRRMTATVKGKKMQTMKKTADNKTAASVPISRIGSETSSEENAKDQDATEANIEMISEDVAVEAELDEKPVTEAGAKDSVLNVEITEGGATVVADEKPGVFQSSGDDATYAGSSISLEEKENIPNVGAGSDDGIELEQEVIDLSNDHTWDLMDSSYCDVDAEAVCCETADYSYDKDELLVARDPVVVGETESTDENVRRIGALREGKETTATVKGNQAMSELKTETIGKPELEEAILKPDDDIRATDVSSDLNEILVTPEINESSKGFLNDAALTSEASEEQFICETSTLQLLTTSAKILKSISKSTAMDKLPDALTSLSEKGVDLVMSSSTCRKVIASELLVSATTIMASLESAITTVASLESATTAVASLESATPTVASLESATTTIASLESATTTVTSLESTTPTVASLESPTTTIASLESATTTVTSLEPATTIVASLESANTALASSESATNNGDSMAESESCPKTPKKRTTSILFYDVEDIEATLDQSDDDIDELFDESDEKLISEDCDEKPSEDTGELGQSSENTTSFNDILQEDINDDGTSVGNSLDAKTPESFASSNQASLAGESARTSIASKSIDQQLLLTTSVQSSASESLSLTASAILKTVAVAKSSLVSTGVTHTLEVTSSTQHNTYLFPATKSASFCLATTSLPKPVPLMSLEQPKPKRPCIANPPSLDMKSPFYKAKPVVSPSPKKRVAQTPPTSSPSAKAKVLANADISTVTSSSNGVVKQNPEGLLGGAEAEGNLGCKLGNEEMLDVKKVKTSPLKEESPATKKVKLKIDKNGKVKTKKKEIVGDKSKNGKKKSKKLKTPGKSSSKKNKKEKKSEKKCNKNKDGTVTILPNQTIVSTSITNTSHVSTTNSIVAKPQKITPVIFGGNRSKTNNMNPPRSLRFPEYGHLNNFNNNNNSNVTTQAAFPFSGYTDQSPPQYQQSNAPTYQASPLASIFVPTGLQQPQVVAQQRTAPGFQYPDQYYSPQLSLSAVSPQFYPTGNTQYAMPNNLGFSQNINGASYINQPLGLNPGLPVDAMEERPKSKKEYAHLGWL